MKKIVILFICIFFSLGIFSCTPERANPMDPSSTQNISQTLGKNWTQVKIPSDLPDVWGIRDRHAALEFRGRLHVFPGRKSSILDQNDAYSTQDGSNWYRSTLVLSRSEFGAVVFNGSLWIMGGIVSANSTRPSTVSFTSDGTNWTSAPGAAWTGRNAFGCAAFSGKIWVMGGEVTGPVNSSEVWSSPDGTNWTLVTLSAPWSTRKKMGIAVIKNKMWLFGGYTVKEKNDIWSTMDGTNWTQEFLTNTWEAQAEAVTTVYKDRVWVLLPNSEIWSTSTDMKSWIRWHASAPFGKRSGAAMAGYDDKLWVLGGNTGELKNDIWFSN